MDELEALIGALAWCRKHLARIEFGAEQQVHVYVSLDESEVDGAIVGSGIGFVLAVRDAGEKLAAREAGVAGATDRVRDLLR